jgi:hypothetical protein
MYVCMYVRIYDTIRLTNYGTEKAKECTYVCNTVPCTGVQNTGKAGSIEKGHIQQAMPVVRKKILLCII